MTISHEPRIAEDRRIDDETSMFCLNRLEDLTGLSQLTKIVWNASFDPEYWKWKYESAPFPTNGWLVRNKETVIAFEGYWIRNLYVNHQMFESVMLVDMMSHPEHRGNAFREILSELKKVPKTRILHGWTNPFSYRFTQLVFKRTGDLSFDMQIPIHKLVLNPGAYQKSKTISKISGAISNLILKPFFSRKRALNLQMEEMNSVDSSFDAHWMKLRDEYQVIFERNSAYLQWRYFQHNYGKSTIWKATKNDAMVGYMIATLKTDVHGTKCIIMDWLISKTDFTTFQSLLAECILYAQRMDCYCVEIVMMEQFSEWKSILKGMLFRKISRCEYYLIALPKKFTNGYQGAQADMFLTLGDSDYLGNR